MFPGVEFIGAPQPPRHEFVPNYYAGEDMDPDVVDAEGGLLPVFMKKLFK